MSAATLRRGMQSAVDVLIDLRSALTQRMTPDLALSDQASLRLALQRIDQVIQSLGNALLQADSALPLATDPDLERLQDCHDDLAAALRPSTQVGQLLRLGDELINHVQAMGSLRAALEFQAPTFSIPQARSAALPVAPPVAPVVNTGFAAIADPDEPWEPDVPLEPRRDYYFWLEVGAPERGSIEVHAIGLPIDKLPPEAHLTVALFGFDEGLTPIANQDIGELALLANGYCRVSRAVAQPGSSGHNASRLFFPIKVEGGPPGARHLRCNIYYQSVLVQSRLITAWVGAPPQKGNALASEVDYTLAHDLDAARLASLGTQRMSVMLNQNGDGTHSFRFFGEGEWKGSATLGEGELSDMINGARGALRLAAWGDELQWDGAKPYRYGDGQRKVDRLAQDLKRLAVRGFRMFVEIRDHLSNSEEQLEQLDALLKKPGMLQFAFRESEKLMVPVGLLYDHLLDTTLDYSELKLCPAFLTALEAAAPLPLEDSACWKGQCPSSGALDTVCPSGFWGYRHTLGMPLSIAPDGPDMSGELAYVGTPRMVMGVSTDPGFQLRQAHETALRALALAQHWQLDEGDTQARIMTLLKEPVSQLVYFYCHGGASGSLPYLKVGGAGDRSITPDSLFANQVRWRQSRPLVFINGCHTTDIDPKSAYNFVSAFVRRSFACGVIGTEITIFEPLAREFAEECLRRFLSGETIGDAVRRARLTLLKGGNPLGLVYLPFVIPGLKLAAHPAA